MSGAGPGGNQDFFTSSLPADSARGITGRLCLMGIFTKPGHIQQKPGAHHIKNQRGAAIADKRKRQALGREHGCIYPDVNDRLKAD